MSFPKQRRKPQPEHSFQVVDPLTQLTDVRSFERFIRQKSVVMKRLRRWNLLVLSPLFLNSIYWVLQARVLFGCYVT